jgi:F0F1-type ATP synthase delta subunit
MAENVTLARPYAEAAFQLAKGGNALHLVRRAVHACRR